MQNDLSSIHDDSTPFPEFSEMKMADKNVQEDLNAVDDWMGLLSQDAKRKSKFLTPNPDILNSYKNPKRKKVMPFLKNGSILPTVQLGNKYVKLMNTCPFDSLAQSLLVAYRNRFKYRDYVDKSSSEFLRFIRSLHDVNVNPGQPIYKERARILMNLRPIVGGILDCAINISSLMKDHLLTNEPSCTLEKTCTQCNKVRKDKYVVIEIPFGTVHQNGWSSLEQIIDETMKINDNRKCTRCSSRELEVVKFSGKHLIIDLEICMSLKMAKACGYVDWTGKFTIAQLPKTIDFWGKCYRLVAAIEYIGPIDLPLGSNVIGHYMAHVRCNEEKWNTLNNISRAMKPPPINARQMLIKRLIPVIIYIEE